MHKAKKPTLLYFEMYLLEQAILMALIKSNYLTNTGILKNRTENSTGVHGTPVNSTL